MDLGNSKQISPLDSCLLYFINLNWCLEVSVF